MSSSPKFNQNYYCFLPVSIAKTDSPHHQAVLNSLFSQPPRPSRGFLYDHDGLPEHAVLNDVVQERLATIFRLHGAVDMEPPMLMPMMDAEDESQMATFIDRHGDVVTLPDSLITSFARLAARSNTKRIKRYHIGDIFRPKYEFLPPETSPTYLFPVLLQAIQRSRKQPCLI